MQRGSSGTGAADAAAADAYRQETYFAELLGYRCMGRRRNHLPWTHTRFMSTCTHGPVMGRMSACSESHDTGIWMAISFQHQPSDSSESESLAVWRDHLVQYGMSRHRLTRMAFVACHSLDRLAKEPELLVEDQKQLRRQQQVRADRSAARMRTCPAGICPRKASLFNLKKDQVGGQAQLRPPAADRCKSQLKSVSTVMCARFSIFTNIPHARVRRRRR